MVHLTRILLFGFYIVFSMAFSQSNDWENRSYTGKGKEKPHTGFVLFLLGCHISDHWMMPVGNFITILIAEEIRIKITGTAMKRLCGRLQRH